MRKENIVKEKEKQQAIKDLKQIEAKAMRSYQKDLAASKENKVTSTDVQYGTSKYQHAPGSTSEKNNAEWVYDESSGYYFNGDTKYFYDPNSGLYYSDALGKWVTKEAANSSSQISSVEVGASNSLLSDRGGGTTKQSSFASTSDMLSATAKASTNANERSNITKNMSGPPPGPVLPSSKVPSRSIKAAPSSIQVAKRKREEKPGRISSEEAAAIAAREAARKRTDEREKSLLGLYKAY